MTDVRSTWISARNLNLSRPTRWTVHITPYKIRLWIHVGSRFASGEGNLDSSIYTPLIWANLIHKKKRGQKGLTQRYPKAEQTVGLPETAEKKRGLPKGGWIRSMAAGSLSSSFSLYNSGYYTPRNSRGDGNNNASVTFNFRKRSLTCFSSKNKPSFVDQILDYIEGCCSFTLLCTFD